VKGVIGDVGNADEDWGEVSYAAVEALGIQIKDWAYKWDKKSRQWVLVGPVPFGIHPVVISKCCCSQ
jgi:hypothetical protein